MTDHAVIVPTRSGPVGAVVSEPEGEQRGALVLLQGAGPPCRAGVNAIWARVARELAALGIVVLRFDFAREGDSFLIGEGAEDRLGWRRNMDLRLAREVTPWLRERAGVEELFVAGSCYGARLALELAVGDPGVTGSFLVIPYLWHQRVAEHKSGIPLVEPAQPGPGTLNDDDALLDGFRAIVARGPVWVLIGDRDPQDIFEVRQRLGAAGEKIEVDVVPGIELHPVTHPDEQAPVRERLVDRLARALPERQQALPSAP